MGKAARELNPSPVATINENEYDALKACYGPKIQNTYSPTSSYNTRSRTRKHSQTQQSQSQMSQEFDQSDTQDTMDTEQQRLPLHQQVHTEDSIKKEFNKLSNADTVLLSLAYLQKGKATGPAAESTDCLKKFFSKQIQGRLVHLPKLMQLVHIVLNRELHPTFEKFFTSSTLTALHKDVNKPLNLRPIGVGGVL